METPHSIQEKINKPANPKWYESDQIECPGCSPFGDKDTNNHLISVTVLHGSSDDYTSPHAHHIDLNEGSSVIPGPFHHEARLRGLGLLINFECETRSHAWVRRIWFHKGSSFQEDAILGKLAVDEHGIPISGKISD